MEGGVYSLSGVWSAKCKVKGVECKVESVEC